jgi:diguanylate cyclase (GGDEF)-like protein
MLSLFQTPKVVELQQRCEKLARVTSLLLEGIRLHSVPGQEEGYLKFREAIEVNQKELVDSEPDRMLAVAAAVLQLMSDYARVTGTYHSNGRRALQGMITMLTQAVDCTVEGRDRSITTLQNIIAKVDDANCVHDLESVRGQLEVCLHAIKDQKNKHVEEQVRLRGVMSEVSAALTAAGCVAGPGTDPVTGLRNRAAAQEDLAQAFGAKKSCCVSLLRLETLVAINSRYGRASGDEYFQKVSRLVREQTGSLDRLFRWEGAVLLVLVEDDQPVETVRKRLRKLISVVCSNPLAIGGRSALLQVNFSSLCLEMRRYPELAALTAQIDSFVYTTTES